MSEKDDAIDSVMNGEEKQPTDNGGKELEQAKAELLYLRAEFDNFRKRMIRDQEQSVRFANEKLIQELFTVVDLFDRAVESAQTLKEKADTAMASFISGVEMTQKELGNVLNRFGVEFVGAPGEKFDPSRHEAIAQQPAPADKNDTVLQVVQKGGVVNGKLVKPARVVVGKSDS